MNMTLGKEFERRITEKVSDSLRMLFEKDVAKNKQLEILREEVAKGFEHLAAGDSSTHSVMDIFEQVSRSVDSKPASKDTNVEL